MTRRRKRIRKSIRTRNEKGGDTTIPYHRLYSTYLGLYPLLYVLLQQVSSYAPLHSSVQSAQFPSQTATGASTSRSKTLLLNLG